MEGKIHEAPQLQRLSRRPLQKRMRVLIQLPRCEERSKEKEEEEEEL